MVAVGGAALVMAFVAWWRISKEETKANSQRPNRQGEEEVEAEAADQKTTQSTQRGNESRTLAAQRTRGADSSAESSPGYGGVAVEDDSEDSADEAKAPNASASNEPLYDEDVVSGDPTFFNLMQAYQSVPDDRVADEVQTQPVSKRKPSKKTTKRTPATAHSNTTAVSAAASSSNSNSSNNNNAINGLLSKSSYKIGS